MSSNLGDRLVERRPESEVELGERRRRTAVPLESQEAEMTDLSPIERYGYFLARDRTKHGDRELADACEIHWTSEERPVDASKDIAYNEGVSAWISTKGEQVMRRIYRNEEGRSVVASVDAPATWALILGRQGGP